MHHSAIFFIIGASTSFVAASPLLAVGSPSVSGVATFNNYTQQGQSVCLGKGGSQKPCQSTHENPIEPQLTSPLANMAYFGAAIGDISRDISGGLCDGSHNGADQSPQSYDASKWYDLRSVPATTRSKALSTR